MYFPLWFYQSGASGHLREGGSWEQGWNQPNLPGQIGETADKTWLREDEQCRRPSRTKGTHHQGETFFLVIFLYKWTTTFIDFYFIGNVVIENMVQLATYSPKLTIFLF